MNKTHAGVLADTRLFWIDDAGNISWKATPGTVSASQLCELGLQNNLHCIWILPGSQLSQLVADSVSYLTMESEGYDVRYRAREKTDIPMYGSVKRNRGTWEEKRLVYFQFPEHNPAWLTDDDTWALADVENPQELAEVISSVEAALSPRRIVKGCLQSEPFNILYSPGYCGMSLLRLYMKLFAHVAWFRPADLSMLPDIAEPGGFNWTRELLPEEAGKKYIHFYDRNAQFPAAATGAELGEGTPVHTTTYNEKLPGIWNVTVESEPTAFGTFLPHIAPVGTAHWMYTPTVQALQAAGYAFTVHKGYCWPVHHRTLQDWAKGLWDARKALREKYGKGSSQEHMVKMIANRGMGWLDLGEVRRRGRDAEKDVDNRPDWYNTIRSLARFRMVLKLIELAKLELYPVMIVADNIGYVSDEPNPELAAPGLMVRKTELGGFKHDGTYLLSEVLPLMKQYGPNDVRRHVKALQKVEM